MQILTSRFKKLTLWVTVGLILCLFVLAASTFRWLEQDRIRMANRLSEDNLASLSKIASEVEEDFKDIAENLWLAARIVQTGPQAEETTNILAALLGMNKAYHSAAVYDQQGSLIFIYTDPRHGGPLPPKLLAGAANTASKTFSGKIRNIQVSPLFSLQGRWIRVFATKFASEAPGFEKGSVAVVVDMQSYMDKLKAAASDAYTMLLVIGPHRTPSPISNPVLVRALETAEAKYDLDAKKFNAVLWNLRLGKAGTTRIGGPEAKLIGLGEADVIAAYVPIRIDVDMFWSAATFTSMIVLKDRERLIFMRMIAASTAIGLILVLVGGYIVVSNRRKAIFNERLHHLNEVAHLNEKARKVLDTIPMDVLVVSSDGLITDANLAFWSRHPHRSKDGRIEEIFDSASKQSLTLIDALVKDSLSSRIPSSIVGEKMALYGQEGYFSLHAVPLDPPSPGSSLLLAIEDLTDVKSLESKLLFAEKLATVGVLAAGLAHEIGTPLGVVRGRAEYILEKIGPEHSQASGLKVIVDQIDRVVRTINRLLDFSRPKAAEISPVDVKALILKCAELLQYEAKKSNVAIETEIEEELPPAAADEDQLEQVLINLIMNAIDASEPETSVIVSAKNEQKNGKGRESEAIRIEVTDKGCGIPNEYAHRVFDPFFTTKKRGQSTGLGLVIVSQIVCSHNAEIQLISAPGQGTKAVLIWPVLVDK